MRRLHEIGTPLVAALALACFGCGSSVNFDDVNEGGSGTGASGTGASGTGASGTGASGGGPGGICEPFEDADGSVVTLRVVNESLQPVYLNADCGSFPISIERAGGNDDVFFTELTNDSCFQSCEDLQTSEPQGCVADCAALSYIIPPGSSLDFPWSGLGFEPTTEMPEACFESPDWGTSCTRVIDAPAGNYTIDARGYAQCMGDCTCQPDGQCWGSAGGLEAWAEPTSFNHPSQGVVELVFGVCAFGCAENGGS